MTTATEPIPLDTQEIFDPDGYAMRVIRYRAGWLVRNKGVPKGEQDDIEQELSIRLLKRLKKYDPSRSKLTTYIAFCVSFDAQEVLRQRYADKHVNQRATRSLDLVIGQRFGRRRSLGDVMTRSQQVRGRGRIAQDDQREVDLQEDFQAVFATLPPDLQKVCEKLLATRNPATAQHSVSAQALAAIRQHFEEAGLRAYL